MVAAAARKRRARALGIPRRVSADCRGGVHGSCDALDWAAQGDCGCQCHSGDAAVVAAMRRPVVEPRIPQQRWDAAEYVGGGVVGWDPRLRWIGAGQTRVAARTRSDQHV